VSGGESRQRRTVYFRGHVQGVGFRFTTLRIAATCAVDGFVQNLSDGGVLVVTEGTSEEVDRFLRKLEGELSGHIHHSDMTQSAATGEFTGFDIRY
jgi:acylphosphatase